MQVIFKKIKQTNNSPRGVIPDTRKLFRNNSAWRIIILAFLVVSANAFALLSQQAFAEAGANLTFTVNVPSDPLLEIQLFDGDGTTSLQNAVSMNVVPGYYSAGFNEQDVTIKVATNNTWGYNLVMNVANTALTSGNNTIANLATKTGGYTCTRETAATCDFTANSWGYKIKTATSDQAATNYMPVPTSITLNHNGQASDGGVATGGTTELAFASRINAQQAPGAYSTTINFVATANPKPLFNGITTMQEMTPQNCAAADENDTSQLIDTRDNTMYTVAKLADGNCWMTQNLALGSDSLGEITLTSADSDVSSDFPLPAPTTTSFSSSNYNVTNYRNYTSNSTNYYNWYTATAGTGTQSTTAYTAATSSICPKGWRLPNGSSASGVAGEWAELLYAAGITSTLATGTSSVSYTSGGATKLAAAPYNIPNTYGYFNTTGTAPTSATYTYFWTNRTYSGANNAWSTYIGSSSAILNYGNRSKYQGMPMRCVAHKAEIQPTITYDANGGTGAPSPTQAAGAASEFPQSIITLSSITPTKSGQSFVGWNTKQDGTGVWGQPGGTITIASDTTLYAIWFDPAKTFDSAFAAAGKTKQDGYYKMQDMSADICSSVSISSPLADSSLTMSGQLIDTRGDKKVYWVARLTDGKCWMLDNLALGGASTIELTPSDTNIAENWFLPASGTANFDSANGYTNAAINADSKNVSQAASQVSGSLGSGNIGVYYNYCAASAGTYCYPSSSSTGDAEHDICPKGWRMPTGGGSGEYQALYTAYSSNATDYKKALSLPLSGYFVAGGSARDQGSRGFFWSSTRYIATNMYSLIVDSSSVDPQDYGYRYYGHSVRCVSSGA